MKAHEVTQPSTPWPSGGQVNGGDAVGGQPPFVPDYTLLCRIGIGAYGDVWLARSTLGAYRAVKIVSRRSFENDQPFEREFKGIQRFEPISLTHESQVKILHVGRNEDAGYFYYVMELADDAGQESSNGAKESRVDGQIQKVQRASTAKLLAPGSYVPRTLKHELQTRGRLPVDECVQIGLALTTALAHLHGHGLIHRDVKPSNIIFVNGVPKLADIGLVTDVEATRSFVGTEGFIPPEGPGTVSADLYSLGKVLYEISMGRSRLDFPALPANWDDLSEDDQARLREFNEVLVKACESDAARRYGSARQMHDDLGLLQRGKSVRQKRTAEQRWAMAKKLVMAVAVMAVLAAVIPSLKNSKNGHTPTPEAWREYERGRYHCNQLTPEAHKKALEHLSRAAELDPNFVLPYRELTALYVWGQPGLFAGPEERLLKVKEIADKLIAMDPKLAEGHTALSWYKFLNQDWTGAEDEIVRAIKLDPNYPFARDIYTFYLSMLGRPEEALHQAQRSQELDPTARTSAMVAAWPFIAARQFDKAIAQLQRVIELDKNFPEAHNFLGRCYEAQSNYIAAIEAWRTYDLMVGHDRDRVTASYDALRQAYDTGGEQGYLRKYIDLIRENESLPESEQIFFAQDVAGYYARLGENEKALDEIEKHLDEWPMRHQLKFEPMFDTLQNEPRFKALLKKAGLEK